MASTAYKGRKTNLMNFLGRRIHFRFFHSTFCTFNSLFTSNQEYLYADLLRCQKGLFTDVTASHVYFTRNLLFLLSITSWLGTPRLSFSFVHFVKSAVVNSDESMHRIAKLSHSTCFTNSFRQHTVSEIVRKYNILHLELMKPLKWPSKHISQPCRWRDGM